MLYPMVKVPCETDHASKSSKIRVNNPRVINPNFLNPNNCDSAIVPPTPGYTHPNSIFGALIYGKTPVKNG